MILLKHLSREFDIDPYRLRKLLRAAHYEPTNRRWRWQNNDPTLDKIRHWLGGNVGGSGINDTQKSLDHG